MSRSVTERIGVGQRRQERSAEQARRCRDDEQHTRDHSIPLRGIGRLPAMDKSLGCPISADFRVDDLE